MHICTSFAPLCLIHCMRVCVCVALHLADSIGELEAKVVATLVVVAVVYCFNFSFARSPPNISPKRKKEKNKWVQVEEGKGDAKEKNFWNSSLSRLARISVQPASCGILYLYLYSFLHSICRICIFIHVRVLCECSPIVVPVVSASVFSCLLFTKHAASSDILILLSSCV